MENRQQVCVCISMFFTTIMYIFLIYLMHHRFIPIHFFQLVDIHLFIFFEKLSVELEHLCQFYGYFIVIRNKQYYNFMMFCYFYVDNCWQFVKVHPFCFKAMCKTNCNLEAKFEGVDVGGYHCDGHGIYGLCICQLCKH